MRPEKEYQVRPVVRYVVTEYTPPSSTPTEGSSGKSVLIGEFANEEQAKLVARAFMRNEQNPEPVVYPVFRAEPTEAPLPPGVYVGNTGQIDTHPL